MIVRSLELSVVAYEIVGTTWVDVRLGERVIGTYEGHTRYEDRALGFAVDALAIALQPLIDQAMLGLNMERVEQDQLEEGTEHGRR